MENKIDNRQFSLLSLIIPAYKQERNIRRDIDNILSALIHFPIPYELIVVIDGNIDNSMKEAKKVQSKLVRVVGYETNHGKGYAVRYGMAQSKGDLVGFLDAGGDLSPSAFRLMYEHMCWYNADIMVGSKRHPVSKVKYPWYRKIFSFGYQQIVRLLFGINIRDSQVGMKLYKRKVLEDVLPRLLVKEFAFDIEILAVAYHLGYRRIFESPIELNFSHVKSTISTKKFWVVILSMIKDTLAVYYRLNIRHYYDTASQRKWILDPELNFRVNVD
jgi:glycosyltransferase involved in cell wall biosynthesis